jgi:hypothetical protein
MLDDPSPELRRDAVAVVVADAEKKLAAGDKDAARAAYRKALTGAVDEDQVEDIAKALKELGVNVDLNAHYGFIRSWHLVAPFDNSKVNGFSTVYPPEKGVDLKAVYKGKGDAEAKWVAHTTEDPHGLVDLNKVLTKHKGCVAYVYAVVESETERPVEVRVGSITAIKVFLNGEELFAREEYHHGMRVDQYVARGILKKGRNEVLLKVCQNEQTEDWAQNWLIQARLSDATGCAVPFKQPAKEVKP